MKTVKITLTAVVTNKFLKDKHAKQSLKIIESGEFAKKLMHDAKKEVKSVNVTLKIS